MELGASGWSFQLLCSHLGIHSLHNQYIFQIPKFVLDIIFLKKYLWSHVSSLYILEIKPLPEVSLVNMFSHMFGSLFILLMFSLAVKKLFILMKSHLFILSFMSLAPGGILVKILLCGIPGIFLPVFSYRTFMLS